MENTAVERAMKLHRQYPGLVFPLDMDQLACLEGCEIVDWPLLFPVKEVKRGCWIGIAMGAGHSERRFLIAHALGHHLLHSGNQLSFYGPQKASLWKQEKEADEFAAHLLMPTAMLEEIGNLPAWELAERFGMPEEIVRLRMGEFATQKERSRWQEWEEV